MIFTTILTGSWFQTESMILEKHSLIVIQLLENGSTMAQDGAIVTLNLRLLTRKLSETLLATALMLLDGLRVCTSAQSY